MTDQPCPSRTSGDDNPPPAHITDENWRRSADAFPDLVDPEVMAAAWR